MGYRGLLLFMTLALAAPVFAAAEAGKASTGSAAPAIAEPLKAPLASEKKNPDPWEKYNRAIFVFNDTLDRYALKPVAKAYKAVTPQVARTGITHFFINLRSPTVILNDVLQGKMRQAGSDTARFVVNSTVGIVGFIDVAMHWHMPMHDEDFGQTLGKWGMGPGPYLMLPFLGPSTVRDAGGFVVDSASHPRRYLLRDEVDWGLTGVDAVNGRANLLDIEEIVQGDRYLFIRDLYLQRREFSVKDGQVDDPFLDGAEYEDEPEEEGAPEASEASAGEEVTPETPASPAETGPTTDPEADEASEVLGSTDTRFLFGAPPVAGLANPQQAWAVTMASSHQDATEEAGF